ncbi:hypothetical protein SSX86_016594 [Deinandra increscens subsp. villosa]|uniref:Reverse transcriptase domain-containing protein n=1 Tax=Deinandra increscens subsp. villosa TaxID=3103831 RepID=A0AAP0D002_9ASTR
MVDTVIPFFFVKTCGVVEAMKGATPVPDPYPLRVLKIIPVPAPLPVKTGKTRPIRVGYPRVPTFAGKICIPSGGWVDELLHVLWSLRTMPKSSHGETPFSLTYGTEVVIPAEVGVPTRRMLENGDNEKSLRENLDVLEERREVAAIREAKYKQNMARYYNKNVKSFQFKEGDLVLRSNEASRVLPGGKLSPNWEGPYQILEVLDKGSYVLGNADGSRVPRTWNGLHLRKYNI